MSLIDDPEKNVDPPVADNKETQELNQGHTEDSKLTPLQTRSTNNRPVNKLLSLFINSLMILVLALLGLLIWQRFLQTNAQALSPVTDQLQEVSIPTQAVSDENRVQLGTHTQYADADPALNVITADGIMRLTENHTIIPDRPRQEVITYTVQRNDTLFAIADKFSVKPETILWGNFETLQDNPHLLKPDQVLNILPVDGTYYQWKLNDNLNAVANFFGIEPQAIIDYPGNEIDLTTLGTPDYGIKPESWLIVPGGKRAIKDWGPPAITRQNAAAARYYGDGSCGAVYEGAIGSGTFVWPTVVRSISGYNYSAIHPAIDIAGATGNAVLAADSGVIVFAGWSNYGYGYMVVIDHGNGYQTAYAHLSAVAVTCGQSVFQGGYIGAVGNTGNSAGSHLHFELSYNGAKLNPLEYLN